MRYTSRPKCLLHSLEIGVDVPEVAHAPPGTANGAATLTDGHLEPWAVLRRLRKAAWQAHTGIGSAPVPPGRKTHAGSD